MVRIKQKIHWSSSKTKVIATGSDLKEACMNWYNNRNNNDDLWAEFTKSTFYVELEEDYSNENEQAEAFVDFINELTGDEMFEIMRDGNYTSYEDDEEDDEDYED